MTCVTNNFPGRWDTPNHELFSTLMHEHDLDFMNTFLKKPKSKEGPRQAWHDIHSKLEGPVAKDIFTNFYERWWKQCSSVHRLPQLDPNLFDLNCLSQLNGTT